MLEVVDLVDFVSENKTLDPDRMCLLVHYFAAISVSEVLFGIEAPDERAEIFQKFWGIYVPDLINGTRSPDQRPSHDVIAVYKTDPSLFAGRDELSVTAFALTERSPNCPGIGTKVEVFAQEVETWKDQIYPFFSAILCDAENSILKRGGGGKLTIVVHNNESVYKELLCAKNNLTQESYKADIDIKNITIVTEP